MDLFLKMLRWTVSISLSITGLYFLIMVQMNDDIKPIMPAILCFGVVYWLYKSKDDLPVPVAVVSALTITVSFLCMRYIPLDYQLLNAHFYVQWLSWAGLLGIPSALFVFWKFD